MIETRAYPCPLPGAAAVTEFALGFDKRRDQRVLIVPALLDESNRLRRFTVEVMRRLDGAGIDCWLPDLPGTNESNRDLATVTAAHWALAVAAAASKFNTTHVLAIRGGAMFAPVHLPGWHYAPVKGASQLRTLLRARVLAAREAGLDESSEALLASGLADGLELAGYRLSPEMIQQLHALAPATTGHIAVIEQRLLGGSGLWLRAEPDESAAQADALAAIISATIAA